jgi:tetratricopeptide (TPR) repeat protein
MLPISMRRAAPAVVVLVLFLAACGTPSALRRAQKAWDEANYLKANLLAEEALEQNPDDARVRAFHRKARLRGLTALGQRLVFQDRDDLAIEVLERALEIEPYDFYAQEWINKAKVKLAQRYAREASGMVGGGRLDEALATYQKAIEYDPGNVDAREGLEQVAAAWAGKQDKARDHFLRGLRARADGAFDMALYHFRIAAEQDPTNEEARAMLGELRDRIGTARFDEGLREEEAGAYRAALLDYEAAAELLPDDEDLKQRIALCRREVEAENLRAEGEVLLFRGEFQVAREKLQRAYQLTSRQKIEVQDLLVVAREREADERYRMARDLELQERLDEALAAFRALDEEFPGFLDTRAMITRLETAIEIATTSYQQGREAEDRGQLDDALSHYIDAVIAWPSYEDVAERIERLRAMQQPAADKTGS